MRALVALALCLGGCRAQVAIGPSDAGSDFGGGVGDAAGADGLPVDLASDRCAGLPPGPEICDNGCDDDGNGFVDGDDPACTPQLLVTTRLGGDALERLLLGAAPRLMPVDGHPVLPGSFAVMRRSFAPALFLTSDASRMLARIGYPSGGAGVPTNLDFTARDVCIFGDELVVIDLSNSRLRRYAADGKTELTPGQPVAPTLSACTSSGDLLYVARHDGVIACELRVYDSNFILQREIDFSPAVRLLGFDRCLDVSFTRSGALYGLLGRGQSSASNDGQLDGQVVPLSLDGGAGPPLDAGTYHGIGYFAP